MRSHRQQPSNRRRFNGRAIAIQTQSTVPAFVTALPGSRRPRSAYTLFEMLLVVGLIAAFVSMVVPSAMRFFSQEKLLASAEKIRAGLATARVKAIESGLIYQFCSEANGSHFVVAPFEPDHLNAGGGNSIGNSTATANFLGRYTGALPKGMSLNSNLTAVSAGSGGAMSAYKVTAVSLDGLPNAGDLAGLNWSIPVLFNADGSANMDREIIVSDSHAQRIRIHIRAFTGAATVSRIYLEKR